MVYDKIAEYRRTHTAAVDTMGCERLGDAAANPKNFRFQTLLALMLSSRTKDEVTADAIKKLNQLGEISAKSVLEMDGELLGQCISKVGFHQSKRGFIQRSAKICVEQYDGDIPDNVEDLIKLPGVGPKMAYLTMQCAWFKNTGIGVDIHVHRITNRLGWVKTTAPEDTRVALEDWLPQEYWRGINPLLVGFGQIMCKGVKPKCSECPVSQWCPSAQLKKSFVNK
ncbi:DNA glycosylase [Basidiobolus meristosporus CBS 931.73]|uniref:Endonuclease III homolog n=1 Tax=Basidiobolus meristosporus CBS 931.73 TaxID=1314790 RepID=A0A1Y1YW39_9FUNG|nr:DNA glycosylase [Basidiobolus meristosporus CBS 931.73]|eukprot:ORY02250.1 DNA glycosylase [Basidiobolus meristosporus CBS 931.73]